MTTALRPCVILFGDSITEQSFYVEGPSGVGWGALLAAKYIRRADILSRGLSGYNTRWALEVLSKYFPPETCRATACVTVFFGANDAAVPSLNPRQHVPIEEFKKNLATIATYLLTNGVANVVLMSCPPVVEAKWHRALEVKYSVVIAESDRKNDATRAHAAAVGEVAAALGLPFVDIFGAMTAAGDGLDALLDDGLHLSGKGNALVAAEVARALVGLGITPDTAALDTPLHGEVRVDDLQGTFRPYIA